MRTWKEVEPSERIEGEHLFVIAMYQGDEPWVCCRWCQQFEHAVEDRPCSGPMRVKLN